jgi:TetR/AcrR family transcriptional regulator, copper-responsive repressor
MVQKEEAKRRGRPRSYDPGQALQQIMEAFWKTGYSGTSLDDLSAATGLNRPSLYAAFGDKREIYLKALAHYRQLAAGPMGEALSSDAPLRDALMQVYRASLSLYFPPEGIPRGCFVIGTATTEAVEEPEIRKALMQGLRRLDAGFAARIEAARERGEIPANADTSALAALASATLYSLAIRARAGASREELEKLAQGATSVICSPGAPAGTP